MKLSDLIIIYLACGSPFGVYQITKRQQDRSATGWVLILSSFLFWPVFAIGLLVDRFVPGKRAADTAANARIECIRSEIERAAFPSGATASLFEFREVFYRFTGLFEAANIGISTKRSNELFEVIGHSNKALASQCLARRNREKLAYHQMLARNEFVDVIADLAGDKAISEEIGRLSLELTTLLDDVEATVDLTALLPGRAESRIPQTGDLEKEVWKSRTPSTSTIN
jgi:hypothetical protein